MNAPVKAPDRIVADMVAAHDAREVFPTGHTFSMTSEVDGKSRAISVATCECGAVIRLLATKHLEMDAAVEAHWQRFDHVDDRGQPVGDRVDGRGRPIVPGWRCVRLASRNDDGCNCQVVDREHSFAECIAKRQRCGNWRRSDESLAGLIERDDKEFLSREDKQAGRPDSVTVLSGETKAAVQYSVSVQISGGAASYVAAKLTIEEFGHDGVALVFADTKIEDEDLYRFLDDAEKKLDHPIIRIAEGRDPWTVFFDERMMGNSRIDPCSKILKRKLLDRWRVENCTEDCALIVGYDATEDHRFQPFKARMAPVNVRAPLLERGIWREQAHAIVTADGLRLPRLYEMGFPHNNCGGFCVKAGQATFALLLEQMPERYAEHEAKEEAFRAMIGKDVSIMRDRRDGGSKPLTMKAFRERYEANPMLLDRSDLGGCTCMEEPSESAGDRVEVPPVAPSESNKPDHENVEGSAPPAGVPPTSEPAAAASSASQPPAAAGSPETVSKGEQFDWETLRAIAFNKPVDEFLSDDAVKRGYAFLIDLNAPQKGFGLTDRGWARLEKLKPIFQPAGTAEGTYEHSLNATKSALPSSDLGHDLEGVLAAPPIGGSDDDDIAVEWPSYDAFLEQKIVTAPVRGIEVRRDELHDWLKPHCKDLVLWALRLGCAAIFANFGLHKTAMQLEWVRQLSRRHGDAPTLCVLPLGVRHGFIDEAQNEMGMRVAFIRSNADFAPGMADGVRHFLTNYESIRDGKLDPNLFVAVSLDEASVLRSYGSKTFQEFLPLFDKVPFKLVATATPSPNRYKELIHYAGFLGVMDTGQSLTRWFQRNSEKAGDLTLYPHKSDEFWMWVHSWAAFLQRPSDLGHSDEGYLQPPIRLRWHEVPADHSKAKPERDGQGVMFRNVAHGLSESATVLRESMSARIEKAQQIVAADDPETHWLLWHDLESEREAIEAAIPDVVAITGTGMDLDDREILLRDFEEGRIKRFATKPMLSGLGSNFQYHCHKMIFIGLPGNGYKFELWIQALHRLLRFGQTEEVEVHAIYSEADRAGKAALEEKWALHVAMCERMSAIIKQYGLDTLPLRDTLVRSIGVKRIEVKGERFTAINNDAVAECATWPEDSVDQIITSVPFSNHYQYTALYNDFGHTDDNAHFWSQMDFLTAELLRMLKPGRLACIHVKDRVLFGSVTGQGVPTISPFHAEALMHYRAHGFQYLGMITVVTDVVRENNQTYRLGWSENCKDGSKMGIGSPEYVLLMRKPQSDRTRSYADVPVVKQKMEAPPPLVYQTGACPRCGARTLDDLERQCAAPGGDECPRGEGDSGGRLLFPTAESIAALQAWHAMRGLNAGYSRARWQIDAHAFWRSSGNRLLAPEEFAELSPADLAKLFVKTSADRVYDYEAHVKIGETFERKGALPATFMSIAPGSSHPEVWTDVARMRTLNMMQKQKGQEMHLCPLPWDIVDRLIERYSNPGELIFDPFGGLMTVPYRAILKGRRGAATELNAQYFLDGVHYLRMAEEKITTPTLFDLVAFDAANATPPQDLAESEA